VRDGARRPIQRRTPCLVRNMTAYHRPVLPAYTSAHRALVVLVTAAWADAIDRRRQPETGSRGHKPQVRSSARSSSHYVPIVMHTTLPKWLILCRMSRGRPTARIWACRLF
jgi:hypothetical protein